MSFVSVRNILTYTMKYALQRWPPCSDSAIFPSIHVRTTFLFDFKLRRPKVLVRPKEETDRLSLEANSVKLAVSLTHHLQAIEAQDRRRIR